MSLRETLNVCLQVVDNDDIEAATSSDDPKASPPLHEKDTLQTMNSLGLSREPFPHESDESSRASSGATPVMSKSKSLVPVASSSKRGQDFMVFDFSKSKTASQAAVVPEAHQLNYDVKDQLKLPFKPLSPPTSLPAAVAVATRSADLKSTLQGETSSASTQARFRFTEL